MRSSIAALAILGTLAACDIPVKKAAPPADQGLGAGATPAATPAPTPPVDTTATAVQPIAPTTAPAKATVARSTPAKSSTVKKPARSSEEPITQKNDVTVARWDSASGGWTYRKLGDTATTPAVRTPGDTKGDSAFNQQKGDSLKPIAPPTTPTVRTDSIGTLKGDTAFHRIQGNDTIPAPSVMPTPAPLPAPAPLPVPTAPAAPAPQ
jgi:hypothetical protein